MIRLNVRKLWPYLVAWIVVTTFMPSMPFGIQAQLLSAQACSVSVSIATSASPLSSSSCFVPANGVSIIQFTGTWTGTSRVQQSFDGGKSWKNMLVSTVNTTFVMPAQNRNSAVRVLFDVPLTGTLTGTITFNPPLTAKIAYANVPIGSAAYSSFGNNGALGGSTKLEVSDVVIPPFPVLTPTAGGLQLTPAVSGVAPFVAGTQAFSATGCQALVGATTAAETVICELFDVTGNMIANSSTSGVSVGVSVNAFVQIPFVTPVNLLPGRYYMSIQDSGTTTTWNRIAASTFIDVVCGEITGQTYGTLQTVISPPTTFTANKCPIGYLYH